MGFAAFGCSCVGSFRGCSRSKTALDGEGSAAGDVFDRERGDKRGAGGTGCCLDGGIGKSENDGDFVGCGEVARLTIKCFFASSSFAMASLTLLSLSKVAWRLARREDAGCGLRTLENMTLYRSILMLGISTSRNGAGGGGGMFGILGIGTVGIVALMGTGADISDFLIDLVEALRATVFSFVSLGSLGSLDSLGSLGSIVGLSKAGSVCDRIIIGLNFGAFFEVLLLSSAMFGGLELVDSAHVGAARTMGGSGVELFEADSLFLPPRRLNSFHLPDFCLIVVVSSSSLLPGMKCGCQFAYVAGSTRVGLPNAIPIATPGESSIESGVSVRTGIVVSGDLDRGVSGVGGLPRMGI